MLSHLKYPLVSMTRANAVWRGAIFRAQSTTTTELQSHSDVAEHFKTFGLSSEASTKQQVFEKFLEVYSQKFSSKKILDQTSYAELEKLKSAYNNAMCYLVSRETQFEKVDTSTHAAFEKHVGSENITFRGLELMHYTNLALYVYLAVILYYIIKTGGKIFIRYYNAFTIKRPPSASPANN